MNVRLCRLLLCFVVGLFASLLVSQPATAKSSARKCLLDLLSSAQKLEKEVPEIALKKYKAMFACNAPQRLEFMARARLAVFHLRNGGCRACAVFQYCVIRKDIPVAFLPQGTTPAARSLFQSIKDGKVGCPKSAEQTRQSKKPYVVVQKTTKQKLRWKLGLNIRDLAIQKVRLYYSVPWKSGLTNMERRCVTGPCVFTLDVEKGTSKRPIVSYHYRLLRFNTRQSSDLYNKENKQFQKVLIPKELLEKKKCLALPGHPSKSQDPNKILKWLEQCKRVKKPLPKWVWPVVSGVVGLAVGVGTTVLITQLAK